MDINPGRELDVLIAERVFGLTVEHDLEEPYAQALRDRYDELGILPPYSTDIAAAWAVVAAMRRRGYAFGFDDQPSTGVHIARFTSRRFYGASVGKPTDAHAICLAALRALEATA